MKQKEIIIDETDEDDILNISVIIILSLNKFSPDNFDNVAKFEKPFKLSNETAKNINNKNIIIRKYGNCLKSLNLYTKYKPTNIINMIP